MSLKNVGSIVPVEYTHPPWLNRNDVPGPLLQLHAISSSKHPHQVHRPGKSSDHHLPLALSLFTSRVLTYDFRVPAYQLDLCEKRGTYMTSAYDD